LSASAGAPRARGVSVILIAAATAALTVSVLGSTVLGVGAVVATIV